VKLPHLGNWIAARRGIAAEYRNGLTDTGYLVPETCSTVLSFNQFAILHPERVGPRIDPRCAWADNVYAENLK